MLRAYFDRSQLSKPARIVTVSGGVAHAREWVKFESAWQEVLESGDVKWFHMTAFETRHPPFDDERRWTPARRERFIRRLIGVMRQHLFFAVGASLMLDEYDALAEDDKRILGHPYQVCGFKAAIMAIQTLEGLRDEFERTDSRQRTVIRQPLALIFESGDEGMGELATLFERIMAEDGDLGPKIHSCAFGRRRSAPALQSADFWAYECSKHVVRVIGAEQRAIRKSMARMMKKIRFNGQYFNRGRLAEMAASLRRESPQ